MRLRKRGLAEWWWSIIQLLAIETRAMWFIKKQHSTTTTTTSLILGAFPEYLRDDVIVALKAAGVAASEPNMNRSYQSAVDGCLVNIPSRVYFAPATVANVDTLTAQQKAIFASFMTRHHNGHQREYWARALCAYPVSWTAPFLTALLGDYVIEVLEVVLQNLTVNWKSIMMLYTSKNQICLRALNHRILTYWTIYYRYSSPNINSLTDYPGYQLAKQLGMWDRRTSPKLLRKAQATLR
jgi:hypothetical protein